MAIHPWCFPVKGQRHWDRLQHPYGHRMNRLENGWIDRKSPYAHLKSLIKFWIWILKCCLSTTFSTSCFVDNTSDKKSRDNDLVWRDEGFLIFVFLHNMCKTMCKTTNHFVLFNKCFKIMPFIWILKLFFITENSRSTFFIIFYMSTP